MTEEIARATAALEGSDDDMKSKAHKRLMLLARVVRKCERGSGRGSVKAQVGVGDVAPFAGVSAPGRSGGAHGRWSAAL